ncbi:MAG: germination lipoprotein GerS [Romboutsia sp.]
MKKKWAILLTIMIGILMIFVGCQKKESTKEEVYAGFQKYISNIKEYSCVAEVEAKGNKSSQIYVMKHDYKKPNYYKLEIVSPKNLKGKSMEYKDNKIIIQNPEIKDIVELPNEDKNNQYLFIGDFIKNCLQNEEIKIDMTKEELTLETQIPGDNKYFSKQVLYVNTKTRIPMKMEILDTENNIRFNVKYTDFKTKD